MNNTVIVRGAVTVPKALLRNSDVDHIHTTLRLTDNYAQKVVDAFHETPDSYILPKFYFVRFLLGRLRSHLKNQEPNEVKHDWPFNGQLRSHQSDPRPGYVSTPQLADLVQRHKGVFAEAPCGSGKTASAIYVIHCLGMKTIVVMPTEALRKQWREQLTKFLPAVKVTEYSGKKKDLTGDVVIASMQMLALSPIPVGFALLILDEAHMAATTVWQQAMFNVNYRYSLALTATGNRLDGMDDLFRWPTANVSVKLDTDQMPATVIYRPVRHTTELTEALQASDPMRVDQDLALVSHRNSKLVRWLDAAYKNKRRIIVISKSIVQLRLLRDVFVQVNPAAKTAMYTNEITTFGKVVKELKRTRQQKIDDMRYLKDPDAVVFSTVGKAGIGYDDPQKDCLILALPMQDPRQVIGRVQRTLPGKKSPLVLIPVDDLHSVKGRMRGAYFKTLAPLLDKCVLVNECPWYHDLKGPYVRNKVKPDPEIAYRLRSLQV